MSYISIFQQKKLKFFIHLLSCIMIFSLSLGGTYVFAQEVENPPEQTALTFNVSSTIVQPGETVDITVSMKNNPGFNGLDFDFNFENLNNMENVKPISITPLDDFTIGIFSSNLDELNSDADIDWSNNNTITVTWSDADNIVAEESDLFKIRFDISRNAKSGIYNFELEGNVVNEQFERLDYDKNLGSIEVDEVDAEEPIDYLFGDIYYDKAVEIMDASKLSQFLVGKVTLSQYETLAANINYDLTDSEGIVDVKDAIKLSQWLADYDGVVLGDGPDGSGSGRKPTK